MQHGNGRGGRRNASRSAMCKERTETAGFAAPTQHDAPGHGNALPWPGASCCVGAAKPAVSVRSLHMADLEALRLPPRPFPCCMSPRTLAKLLGNNGKPVIYGKRMVNGGGVGPVAAH